MIGQDIDRLMGVGKKSTRVEVGRSKTSMICVLQDKKGMLDTMRGNHQTCILDMCIFKIRDITLLPKVCLVKAMVFPVVMYGCESWTVKKAEH